MVKSNFYCKQLQKLTFPYCTIDQGQSRDCKLCVVYNVDLKEVVVNRKTKRRYDFVEGVKL